ncbi:MAG TPA: DUF420 domain-containing protein [Myxococcaceae bacterium]|jgi:putative membrane protein
MSPTQDAAADARADRTFYVFNALLSATAVSVIAYLLLAPRARGASTDLHFMPAVNASLNATAAVLLLIGYTAIRRRMRTLHKYAMVSAFACSGLFLVGYLVYHSVHGDTPYPGVGPLRAVYFFILISHVALSVPMVPMCFTTLYFSWRGTFARHKKLARWTFPIWLYVSVTGVLVFAMLRAAGA